MQSLDESLQVVVFALGEIEFGIDIVQVREIDRLVPVTHVPHVPSFIEGVINLRGQLVPVIDLRARLGLRAKQRTRAARIIVAEIENRCMGMIVDRVCEVARIPLDRIDDSERVLSGLAAEYGGLARIDERVVILLAVRKLLAAGSIPTVDKEAV